MSRDASYEIYAEAYRKAKANVTDPDQFVIVAQWIADRMAAREVINLDSFIDEALNVAKEA